MSVVGQGCFRACQGGCSVVRGEPCVVTGLEDGPEESQDESAGDWDSGTVDSLSDDQTDDSGFPLVEG